MPQAATQEGEASGSGPTLALRRGRSSTVSATPTTTTRSMALVRARRKPPGSQSPQEPPVRSPTRKRKRGAAANQKSKERTRTRDEEEEEDGVSSAGSSPIRAPQIPDALYEDLDMLKAIQDVHDAYDEKLGRQMELPTLYLHTCKPPTCLSTNPKLLRVRESTTKTVLAAAPSVIGLSSSVGRHSLTRCSGFWVDWDEENKKGTVLTTAHVIRTKSPSSNDWLGKDEYAPKAKVFVHLRDATTQKATMLYYEKHYNLAMLEVRVEEPVQLLSFNDDVKSAEEVFELGRDESSFLTIGHGMVQYLNPNLLERHHYLYVHGADEHPKYDNGGPVIDFDGKIVGMLYMYVSLLHACMSIHCGLRKRGTENKQILCMSRPHLGLKFSAIKLLDPPLIEQILVKCSIDSGLIVQEVSEGSPAEKLGFRVGDVIEYLNGEHVSTTVELENMLLSKYVEGSSGLNSEVDIEVRVFHIRRSLWRSKTLTVKVFDDAEVIVRGASYEDCIIDIASVPKASELHN
ncbi:Putative protease Do-like 14 [Triticum urartu]|uniref:Putative protease Do-like 14 n=1 Tax=Triticum urartu TaxID=4572 RepID=M8A949_TRIUA|nr:Putative protease Do-like 14 [Triticum urartu]